jgi:hypothetical protein
LWGREFPRGTSVIAEGERLHEMFVVEAGMSAFN